MEATGRVLRVSHDERWTEVAIERSGCGGCRQSQICSSAMHTKGAGTHVVRLPFIQGVVDGQAVTIRSPGDRVSRLAMLTYGLPLVLAVVFSLATEFLLRLQASRALNHGDSSEWLVPLACFVGMLVGFFTLSRLKNLPAVQIHTSVATCQNSYGN